MPTGVFAFPLTQTEALESTLTLNQTAFGASDTGTETAMIPEVAVQVI
jgi:hypothetical protein